MPGPRHLGLHVRPLEGFKRADVPSPRRRSVACRHRRCGRPAPGDIVLVSPPFVKARPVSSNAGDREVSRLEIANRCHDSSSVGGGGGWVRLRGLKPIFIFHNPPHLIQSLALILVQSQYRSFVFCPFFGHDFHFL